MGISASSPETQTLIDGYVRRLPSLPAGVQTGAQVAEYYEQKHRFTEASLFTSQKFGNKIEQVGNNCQEKQRLWYLANLVNEKIQGGFEAASA